MFLLTCSGNVTIADGLDFEYLPPLGNFVEGTVNLQLSWAGELGDMSDR